MCERDTHNMCEKDINFMIGRDARNILKKNVIFL